jgi:hypothetical protein
MLLRKVCVLTKVRVHFLNFLQTWELSKAMEPLPNYLHYFLIGCTPIFYNTIVHVTYMVESEGHIQ